MRILLVIAVVLSGLLTLWCAVGFYAAPFQQGETRAELQQSQKLGLSDAAIAIHVARVGGQGRSFGFVALGAGAVTALTVAALILESKRKTR